MGAHGDCRVGNGSNEVAFAGAVAGVHHHRQVGELLQGRHGRDVEGIAGVGLEGADAALTENDLGIALGDNIFRRHEELLERRHHAPLEQDGLAGPAQSLEQGKVLHVPGPDLEDIGVFVHQIDVFRIDDLGNDFQPGSLPSLRQQLEPFLLQALEIVGRGPRLVGPASKNLGAGCLDAFGRLHELFPVLDRAGAGHDHELVPSDGEIVHPDNGTLLLQLLAHQLEGLLDGNDRLHPGDRFHDRDDPVLVLTVADGSDDHPFRTLDGMGCIAETLYLVAHVIHLLAGSLTDHGNDHETLLNRKKARRGGGLEFILRIILSSIQSARLPQKYQDRLLKEPKLE